VSISKTADKFEQGRVSLLDTIVGSSSVQGIARINKKWVKVSIEEITDEDMKEMFPSTWYEWVLADIYTREQKFDCAKDD
jgi:hypothetical protein